MDRAEFLAEMTSRLPGFVRVDLWFSDGDDGHHHVLANITGETPAACMSAAQAVLSVVKGKLTFIRVPPEADSQRDFESMVTHHRGYVRFTFKDEPGEAYLSGALDRPEGTPPRYLGLQPRSAQLSELRKYEWPVCA